MTSLLTTDHNSKLLIGIEIFQEAGLGPPVASFLNRIYLQLPVAVALTSFWVPGPAQGFSTCGFLCQVGLFLDPNFDFMQLIAKYGLKLCSQHLPQVFPEVLLWRLAQLPHYQVLSGLNKLNGPHI